MVRTHIISQEKAGYVTYITSYSSFMLGKKTDDYKKKCGRKLTSARGEHPFPPIGWTYLLGFFVAPVWIRSLLVFHVHSLPMHLALRLSL
jgi:hypothetical protein